MSSIGVPLATVWVGPRESGPRDVLTQALAGEPVEVLAEHDGWLEVALLWQPVAAPGGYRGFVRAGQVSDAPAAELPPRAGAPLELARALLGTPDVWGGLSAAGIDCSGLVHLSHRRAGLLVPRDAADQYAAATRVDEADAVPGDLYFFAQGGGRVSHVGYVVGHGRARLMLHAPESGARVEEGPMSPARAADLVGIGRLAPGS